MTYSAKLTPMVRSETETNKIRQPICLLPASLYIERSDCPFCSLPTDSEDVSKPILIAERVAYQSNLITDCYSTIAKEKK